MEVAKLTDVTRIYKIGEVETRALNGVSLTINEGAVRLRDNALDLDGFGRSVHVQDHMESYTYSHGQLNRREQREDKPGRRPCSALVMLLHLVLISKLIGFGDHSSYA